MPFDGFKEPGYTQVPDVLFDCLMPDLTGAELKVLLYIIRRTLGFKKNADNIALSQMLTGITRHDGVQLDRGTGLSKKTLLAAIASLEERGCIVTERRQSAEKGFEPTTYHLHWLGEPSGKNYTSLGGETTPRVGEETTPSPSSKNYAIQETVLQETEEQESRVALYLYHLLNACKPDDRAEVRAHLTELGNGERVGRAIGRAEMEWDRRQGPRGFWRRVAWWMENGG